MYISFWPKSYAKKFQSAVGYMYNKLTKYNTLRELYTFPNVKTKGGKVLRSTEEENVKKSYLGVEILVISESSTGLNATFCN